MLCELISWCNVLFYLFSELFFDLFIELIVYLFIELLIDVFIDLFIELYVDLFIELFIDLFLIFRFSNISSLSISKECLLSNSPYLYSFLLKPGYTLRASSLC